MRLLSLIVLFLLVTASMRADPQTCRIRSADGWWTPTIELDTIRDGWLVFVDGEVRDSIELRDIDVVRRTVNSHAAGGVVGLGAGLLGVVLIASPIALARAGIGHSRGGGTDMPLIIAGTSIAIGTTWGAIAGLEVHPRDDLDLRGLDDEQRAAALRRFMLDTALLRGE
jgi:hypothetical protein